MPRAIFPPPDRGHAWAPPGEWDWTVHSCLLGSLLLCGGMLFTTASHTSAGNAPDPCVRKLDEVYRVLGPSAWGVLRECRAPEALSLY